MFLKGVINYKKLEKCPYKVVLFLFFLLILPGVFRFLDHAFQKSFGLNRYLNVFDFVFLGFLIFSFVKKNEMRSYFSSYLILFISYIFVARLSIFLSAGEIHHKAYYDLFKSFIAIVLFFIFFTPYFQKNHKNIIKGFLVIFFTIALFESIIGIMQFILQRPIGFALLKEPVFGADMARSATVFISKNKQIFFNSISNAKNNHFLRAHGTFFHPNIFSGFLNISAIFTLYLIYKSKRKIFFSLFLAVQIVALIFTFSRAGLASFVCVSFLFFFLMLMKKYDVKKMFLVFLTILILIGVFFSKYLVERGFAGRFFQSKKAKEMNVGSDDLRLSLKKSAINMIKKHPFWGIGFRNFLIKRNEYSDEKLKRAYVHNIYLLIAAETGLVSLFIFLLFLSLIFINTIKYALNPLAICSICSIISFLLIGFFDHYPVSSYVGRIILFGFLSFLNYSIEINRFPSCSRKVFLYQ